MVAWSYAGNKFWWGFGCCGIKGTYPDLSETGWNLPNSTWVGTSRWIVTNRKRSGGSLGFIETRLQGISALRGF